MTGGGGRRARTRGGSSGQYGDKGRGASGLYGEEGGGGLTWGVTPRSVVPSYVLKTFAQPHHQTVPRRPTAQPTHLHPRLAWRAQTSVAASDQVRREAIKAPESG